MSSVLTRIKEPTSLRRQFTVYPYYNGGQNQYFTVKDNKLYRINSDLSGVDYVVARDMGKEVAITAIDPSIVTNWEENLLIGNISVVRSGTARKFQVLSMVTGDVPTSNLWFADVSGNAGGEENPDPDPFYPYPLIDVSGNNAANGTAYADGFNDNPLFNVSGFEVPINDLLIVGEDVTTTTATTESLPFGTFWVVNDPVVIKYNVSFSTKQRAIKNRIDETTFF